MDGTHGRLLTGGRSGSARIDTTAMSNLDDRDRPLDVNALAHPRQEDPMQYVCLVYLTESTFDTMSEADQATLDEESLASNEELRLSGHLILAQALQPVDAAVTVRVRPGGV